jgi:hypothetical protein
LTLPPDLNPVALQERKPPINEVGSPSALQARRAGPHPELDGSEQNAHPV